MDNLNDLKGLWRSANTSSLPDVTEMLRIIKKFRFEKLRKNLVRLAAAILLSALMVWVIFADDTVMLTTRIGQVMILLCCLILIITTMSSVLRFYKFRNTNNRDFIAFLKQTKKRQLFYYQKTQVVVMILATGSLLFQLVELLHKKNWIYGVILDTICFGLMGLIWFYVRPKVFGKQTKKINQLIERLENISQQIN